MKSFRVSVLIAALVLLPTIGCQSQKSGVYTKTQDEMRDLQQIDADDSLFTVEYGDIAAMKLIDLPSLRKAEIDEARAKNLTYDQVVANPNRYRIKEDNTQPIRISGRIVRIRPRTVIAVQGVEAYVAVDGPDGNKDRDSNKRYVLAFALNTSAAHDGDRCVIFGTIGSVVVINGHSVLTVITRAVLTEAEAAQYGDSPTGVQQAGSASKGGASPGASDADDADLALRPGDKLPNMIAADYQLQQQISDSGGASPDALVANAQQALQAGVTAQAVDALQAHYKDPVSLRGVLQTLRKVDTDVGKMYVALVYTHDHEKVVALAPVFCATRPKAKENDAVSVIGYVSAPRRMDETAKPALSPFLLVIARAILNKDEEDDLQARMPSAP
jgi:hypothetical protein